MKGRELKFKAGLGAEPYFTPTRFGFLAAFFIFAALGAFFSFKVFRFVGTPLLMIEEPSKKETVLSAPSLKVRGAVEKESQLTVSGREIRIDEQGNFEEEIGLQAGLNVLEFWVKDRFGKEAREARYVLVK